MNCIKVHGIRTFSFHGCLEEEKIIGGNYIVNVEVDCDFKIAALKDDLSKTIDYVSIKEIVVKQMSIRSKLIESVAYNIVHEIKENFSMANNCRVEIKKINPPIDGDIDYVSVLVEE
jgi:7,8-dihydroneopterin aldolase/epimerase/oxygenase